jgi:hypothetical protein
MLIVLQTSAGARLVFQSRFLTDSNPEQDSGFKTERLITARLGQETAATDKAEDVTFGQRVVSRKNDRAAREVANSFMVQRNSQAPLDHFMGRGDVKSQRLCNSWNCNGAHFHPLGVNIRFRH